MKKILIMLLAIMITLPLVFPVSASNTTINAYNGITVEFSENSSFTAEQQEIVIQNVVYGVNDSSVTTYNLLCTLLGHSTVTETIGVIEHCVSATAPRCLKTVQDVTMCTRCETVTNTDIISKMYIFCCD